MFTGGQVGKTGKKQDQAVETKPPEETKKKKKEEKKEKKPSKAKESTYMEAPPKPKPSPKPKGQRPKG